MILKPILNVVYAWLVELVEKFVVAEKKEVLLRLDIFFDLRIQWRNFIASKMAP